MKLKKFNEFMLLSDGEIDNIFYEAKTYILENNLVENDYHNNEHMINVFNNAMVLFNHYKDEYKLPPYHKLVLGLAALFHDFDHSGGKLKDSENIELALVALKEFLVTINKSDLYDDIKNIIIATEFPHLDIDVRQIIKTEYSSSMAISQYTTIRSYSAIIYYVELADVREAKIENVLEIK